MKNRIFFCLPAIALAAAGYLSFPKETFAVAFTRSVFLQNITSNSVELRWATDTGGAVTVNYGSSTSYGSSVQGNSVQGGTNNHATVSGLSPNTKYFYQLISGGTALTPAGSQNHYFKTPPGVGSSAPFSFAIWGDSGSSGKVNVPHLTSKKPDLVMVAGDVGYPYDSNFSNNNQQYFDVYKSIMSYTPFYPTCGNHETSCPTMVADASLPQSGKASGVESTFSFDYANVHFTSINSNQDTTFSASNPSSSTLQMSWAYNDLKNSPQPWKILFFHHNGWSSGSHADLSKIIQNVYPLAQAAGVDLVIWGHSHVYERWMASSATGPKYFTIGNGGKANTTSCTSHNPPCLAHSNGEAGFIYAQVNGNSMTVNYITQSGTTADSVVYNSGGGGGVTSPPIGGKPGDANSDNKVDGLDYIVWLNNYNLNVQGGKINGDFDTNGKVDGLDYILWLNNYNL